MQPGAQGWVFTIFTVHLKPGEKLLQKREQYFLQCSRMSQGGHPSSHPPSCPPPAPAALPAGQCLTFPAWGWLNQTCLDQSNHYRISPAHLWGRCPRGSAGGSRSWEAGEATGGKRRESWGWCWDREGGALGLVSKVSHWRSPSGGRRSWPAP